MQNRTFGWLHRAITNKIEQSNIIVSNDIARLLEETDQDQYGPGGVAADIADYLKTKEDVLLFAFLVQEAIDQEKDNFAQIIGSLEALEVFHKKLLNYAQELE